MSLLVSNCSKCGKSARKTLRWAAVLGNYQAAVERWLSGLRRTPGKREYLKSTVGSNPSLSASFLFHSVARAGPQTDLFHLQFQHADGICRQNAGEVAAQAIHLGGRWHELPGFLQGIGILRTSR